MGLGFFSALGLGLGLDLAGPAAAPVAYWPGRPTCANLHAAPRMHAEVFSREPEWSRTITQPLTPAMSASAVAAAEALRSSQLDFAGQ